MSRVLFVAPHPDDETLGCGGTILKYADNDNEVFWMIMTSISEDFGYEAVSVKKRQREIEQVAEGYCFTDTFNLNLPATRLDTIPRGEIVGKVSGILQTVKPEIIYLPNRSDIHSDHEVTFDSLMSATKTFRNPDIKKVLMYETVSETEFAATLPDKAFVPCSFSDISKYMDRKIAIMKLYENELGKHPGLPRSIENIKALATFRGATCGKRYAEAFKILKEIW